MNNPNSEVSRRDFIKTSSLAAGVAAFPSIASAQHKAERIKIGLVGCGGRGSGAANNALEADPGVQLVAMADVFPEKLEASLTGLSAKYAGSPGRIDVPKERQFVGLDAYKQLLATDIDVVLLAAPPGFRPLHFAASVEANKHIFCEKPMGTDAYTAAAFWNPRASRSRRSSASWRGSAGAIATDVPCLSASTMATSGKCAASITPTSPGR